MPYENESILCYGSLFRVYLGVEANQPRVHYLERDGHERQEEANFSFFPCTDHGFLLAYWSLEGSD